MTGAEVTAGVVVHPSVDRYFSAGKVQPKLYLFDYAVKSKKESQRGVERKMLHVKLKDRIRNTIIRQRTRETGGSDYVTKKRNENVLDASPE